METETEIDAEMDNYQKPLESYIGTMDKHNSYLLA